MLISVIIPTNNFRYLEETIQSVENQTFTKREIILLVNGKAKKSLIPERIQKLMMEKKLVFKIAETKSKNIGAIKREAFLEAHGDILVELDHDDLLIPEALEMIHEAFEQHEDVGFVYSDNAKLWEFEPYTWRDYHMVEREGKELYCMHSPRLTPATLGYIRHLPDHIRAWRRETYYQAGCHNELLSVCDDQELIQKTYMITNFLYIPMCLYIYRIHGENTRLERNQEIQETTQYMYRKNIEVLAMKRAEKNWLECIDICGGFNKPEGYTSVDLHDADISANLERRRPFPDGSVGVIRAQDALEHLSDPVFTMQEIHRVLAPDGILLSATPSTDGRGAWQDPTHKSFRNENSFRYRTRPDTAKYIGNDKMFKAVRLETEDWNGIPYVIAHLAKI